VQTGNVKILRNVWIEVERNEKINEKNYWIGQTTEMLNKADERTGEKVKKLAYISNVILG
jgi:hypothetical protein